MSKYERLAADIVEARKAGLQAEVEYVKAHGDGGSCNFDGVEMKLPRWREDKIKEVVGDGWRSGSGWFVFVPDTHCQGMGRTTNAEAMRKYLYKLGYECFEYYCLD